MLALLTFFLLALAPAQQEQRFTPVEGATLQAKHEAAARQAAAAQQPRFWTAHAFDVRPNVAVDVEFVSDDGNFIINDGVIYTSDSDGQRLNPSIETRSLGVFILRDGPRGEILRVEVYNLARRREYSGYPVYWAGRAANEESLNLLRGIVESGGAADHLGRTPERASGALRALALHDDRRVPDTLLALARAATLSEGLRAQAVRSLAHHYLTPGVRDFLAATARDERAPAELRRAAITSYGRARDAQALSFLQGLYESLTDRELKRRVLSSLRENENRDAAAGFLIRVATSDADRELRKRALAQLGEVAGERALGTLRETATSPDADVELQKQALSAVSRRPAGEAVPVLIRVAQTHARPEMRKHALILLGRSGDPAAVEFLRGLLTR
jgi:HEAT repeats